MLFDPRPKSSKNELFDRGNELKELDRASDRRFPLILVLGVRRIGKTSLVRTFLEEKSGVYIDLRGVIRRSELYERVSDGVYSSLGRMRRLLEGIRGISLTGPGVEIRWKGYDSISLLGLLQEVNKREEKFIAVIDEAQSLKPPLSAELRDIIAYSYDNLNNITLIVSGSEVGLLRNFLGLDSPSSPLYGRYSYEIHVERFSEEISREFLIKGFREEKIEPPYEAIDQAIKLFDGIVGWLVFFGRSYIEGLKDIMRIADMAVELALEELNKLSSREKMILKAMAGGAKTWSDVRSSIAEKGVVVPKSTLSRIINKLEMMSIVENYKFLDPVYRMACERLRP